MCDERSHGETQVRLGGGVLELRDVTRAAGREPVLSRASLVLSRETPSAIVGLSAYERDMLMRLLAGVEKPQSGSIKLDGKDIAQARREKGKVVRIDAQVQPKPVKAGKPTGDAGAKVRQAIAKARAERPKLILLDAPSTGLQLEAREQFLADFKSLLADTGAVIVLVAGDADEALGLGGNVVVLHRGEIVQSGPAADVFAHPANLKAAVATSFPMLNTLTMQARNGRGVLADGSSFQPPDELRLPDDGRCTVAFHPDDMTLARAGAGCLRFVVRAAGEEIVAGRRFVRVTFADASWLTPEDAAAPHAGAILNAFVDRSRLMAFDAGGKAIS
ncbi:MAG: ABC transporter ATP-binding protein [Hyphomonadaceae bacterium]|nr:ABC transporter ATP-binding protein [Hyphomonadaceae bacterium]